MALFTHITENESTPAQGELIAPAPTSHGKARGGFSEEKTVLMRLKKPRTADHKRVEKFFLDNQPKPEAKDIAKNDAANFCAG